MDGLTVVAMAVRKTLTGETLNREVIASFATHATLHHTHGTWVSRDLRESA